MVKSAMAKLTRWQQVIWTLEPHQSVLASVLRVLLFAKLRDRAGWEERSIPVSEAGLTAAQVWDQLELGPLESVCVAVNQELVRSDQPLRAGDELAFLPPFTGG